MQSTSILNNALNQNKQMYQHLSNVMSVPKKTILANNCNYTKTQYYNDEVVVKKEKRKKTAKWLTLAFAGFSTLCIAGGLAVQFANKKLTAANIANAMENAKQKMSKTMNRLVNLDHLKNDIWMRGSNFISEKTPIKINKWFNEPISAKYCKISKAENATKHLNAKNIIVTNMKNLKIKKSSYDYNAMTDEAYNEIHKTLNTKGNRVGDVLFAGFKKQSPDETFMTRIKRGFNEFWKISGESVIADEKIKNLSTKYIHNLTEEYLPEGITPELIQKASSKNKEIAQSAFDEIVHKISVLLDTSLEKNSNNLYGEDLNLNIVKETLEKLKKAQDGVYNGNINMEDLLSAYNKNAAESIAKALISLNEIQTKNMSEGIAKMRDIATGDAAFDVLTMFASTAGLGIAVAAEDDKEKRKSTIVNLGIPLMSTLGFSLFGCLKNIPKETGAIIGLALGSLVTQGAKTIDNFLNKKQKNNSDIKNASN